MKPSGTLVFMIAVLAILAVLMSIFPKDGISVSKDLTLYFPDFQEWWADDGKSKGGGNTFIPEMVEEDKKKFASADTTAVVDSLQNADTLMVADMSDVPTFDSSVYGFKPRPIQIDSIRQPLELPASGLGCLKTLFDALTNPDELSKVVRIVHYGDSQIEVDRISGYLRYKLQQQFGGSGPGLIPAKTAYDYPSPCKVVNIGDWRRYTVFPFIDTAVHHSKYGILAAFTRFSPLTTATSAAPKTEPKREDSPFMTVTVETDSTAGASDSVELPSTIVSIPEYTPPPPPKQVYSGALEFVIPSFGYSNTKTVKKFRMIYGGNTSSFDVKVMDGGQILYAETLAPNSFYGIKTWNFAHTPADFRMEFSGTDSPDIYGFAMDGLSGVAVDNVPLRGCSGTIFTKINATQLGQMYRDLNVKCIILQFGGNAVPALNSENVVSFKNYLASQIRYLRRIHPGVSIILIGPADMSQKVQDEYVTYEILPEEVRLLREAAFQNDCAYWDMFAAMGGVNTMPDWVFHDPPFAEKDFIHFTQTGANAMAKMFYNALIARYNQYIRK